MKTSELTGAALDWAVAQCEDLTVSVRRRVDGSINRIARVNGLTYSPSTDWSQGGPIIERDGINLEYALDPEKWCACIMADQEVYGPTPLIAAMRCYVASVLGDEVQLPKELI